MSMYLDVYDCTGDENALTAARVLFGRTLERFSDGQMGGGLRYAQESDERQSYQAAVILAGLRLAAAAKDPTFRDRAMALYDWTEKYMRRTDGLYWCSYRGPDPQRTARAPREAASDTFLGGNMCMAVINAMVYNETKQEIYLQRALDTANGILAHETSASGELLNDRDAWTNAFFAGEWMRNVTTLPGAPSRLRRVVEQTALSIWQKARTEKGLFGACWDGPAEGDGCTWWKQGSKPEQIMVSSNSVNVIVAAAEPGRGSSG